MSITAVLTTRPKSGKYQRVREGMGELKDILAKNGVTVRLTHPLTGEHQGDLSLVSEYDGWAAFGKSAEKVQSSSEYQALMDKAGRTEDSAVESMSTVFYSDVE